MDLVSYIASIVTEDPDIFNEELDNVIGGSGSLSSTEINRNAKEASVDQNSSKVVNDMMKAQEEARKKQEEARKKVVEPQMRQVNRSLDKMNTTMAQSVEDNRENSDNMTDNIATIQSLMGSLEKSL